MARPVTDPRALDGSSDVALRGDPITGERYYSREFAQAEWDHMWTKVWNIAGRESELEQPGDYIVHDLGQESVLAVRQSDGSVRAFYNVCPHRGNRLVWDSGHAGAFTCSYHAWRWGADGLLQSMPDPEDFPGGDPCGKISLKELPCEIWGGFIWFNMDEHAQPLLAYLDPTAELYENYDLAGMVRVAWRRVELNTNWKFTSDNFSESYHVPIVHPQVGSSIEDDYSNCAYEMFPNGHNRIVMPGHPSTRPPPPGEAEALAVDPMRGPWEDVLREWDLEPSDYAEDRDGANQARLDLQHQRRKLGPARGYKHYERLSDDQLTDFYHQVTFPNVTLTFTPLGVSFYRTEPHRDDPEKCYFDYWFLLHPVDGQEEIGTMAGLRPMREADFEASVFDGGRGVPDMAGTVLLGDLSIAEGQQRGWHSRGYGDALLTGQESRVRRFHEVLNDYIEGRR